MLSILHFVVPLGIYHVHFPSTNGISKSSNLAMKLLNVIISLLLHPPRFTPFLLLMLLTTLKSPTTH